MSADYFYLNILPLVTDVGILPASLHAYRRHTNNRYLIRSMKAQLEIHENQRYVIWRYASDRLNRQFVRGVHSYAWLGQKASWRDRGAAYACDIKRIFHAGAPLRLRLWTALKVTVRCAISPSVYELMQRTRHRLQSRMWRGVLMKFN